MKLMIVLVSRRKVAVRTDASLVSLLKRSMNAGLEHMATLDVFAVSASPFLYQTVKGGDCLDFSNCTVFAGGRNWCSVVYDSDGCP